MANTPHIVILGGGFGGLATARSLADDEVEITLVDRRNYHLFQPLLYKVATAALNPADIAYPIRSALRKQKNIRVLLGEAVGIDREARRVALKNGALDYDYLVVATGVTHAYFGHPEWETHAPGLKTIDDALNIRHRIFAAYEAAERANDPKLIDEYLTFVVVGGGPTGVELAGALAEIGKHTLAKEFRHIDPTRVRVVLLEGRDRILPTYPVDLSDKARKRLTRMGVHVQTETIATQVDEYGVDTAGGGIRARTVLWAAGIQAKGLAASLDAPCDRSGRVLVDDDLRIPQDPHVYVVGDLAAAKSDGREVPGVAQGALQGGELAADNIRRHIAGHDTLAFRYEDKGSMATIGRGSAVVHAGPVKLSGFIGWLFWWMVHIMFLVGFRNRLLVMFSWAWSYITFQRGARLITGEVGELPRVGSASSDTAGARIDNE